MPVMCKAAQLIPDSPSESSVKNCGNRVSAPEFVRGVQKESNFAKADREIGCAKLNDLYQENSNRFIETKTICEMILKNLDASLAAKMAQKSNITRGDNQAAIGMEQKAIADSDKCVGQLRAIKSEVDKIVTGLYERVSAVNTLKNSKKLDAIRDLSQNTNQSNWSECSMVLGRANKSLNKTIEYIGGVKDLFAGLQSKINFELAKYQKK
jgi:hypothetical protein